MMSVFGVSGLVGIAVGLAVVMTGAQAWLLWKTHQTLTALQPLEERVSRLSYSLGLLVDTTQGCFDALALQVARREEPGRAPVAPASPDVATASTPKPPTASRQQRQRRVVGAARRGQPIAQIAAQEAMAEGEVALRVQMARDLQASAELT